MKRIAKYFGFVLAPVILMSGCNYQMNKESTNLNTSLSMNVPISFESIKTYSLSSCLKCHSGTQSPNLSTYTDLKLHSALVTDEIATSSMPPDGSGYPLLTACQKDLYDKWVDIGSPETTNHTVSEVASCRDVIGTPPDLTPIFLMPLNYQTLNSKILQPKCLLCHSSSGEEKDLSFYPYSELIKLKEWDAPAAQSSVLDEMMNKEDGMPPPESNLGSLTDDEVEFVKRWIDAGKPEK